MLKLNNICRTHPNMTQLLEVEIYGRRRRTKNMSQYVLADKIGVTRNCIQQMECHEHIPKTETVFDIMQALEFTKEKSAAFLVKYLDAYYKDKELSKEQGKELAGAV